jgi:ABC-type glutathione transport system ATPase component
VADPGLLPSDSKMSGAAADSDKFVQVASTDKTRRSDAAKSQIPVDLLITNCSIHLCRPSVFAGKESGDVVRTLVDGVNLTVRSGELFAIMGGSGSGKTTLLNVIAGRYKASQLRVISDTRDRSVPEARSVAKETDRSRRPTFLSLRSYCRSEVALSSAPARAP